MIKAAIFFFLLNAQAFGATSPPQDLTSGIEPGLFLRAFKDISNATLMAEAGGINETNERNYREVTLGAYHDINANWSAGAFYRRAYGLRHDNDWQSNNGTWEWVDTNSRGEDFLILDTTGRLIVQSLPVENTMVELKTRLLHDMFNGEETLMLRPGVTFFCLRDEQPFMNFFLQYELDLPLNYGRNLTSERWLYFGALYRVAQGLDIGGFVADKWQAWGNASAYDNKGGTPYFITAESLVASALAIWHIP
jgi:hypothetical protein